MDVLGTSACLEGLFCTQGSTITGRLLGCLRFVLVLSGISPSSVTSDIMKMEVLGFISDDSGPSSIRYEKNPV